MRKQLTTSDKSIENAGIPKDYRQAIEELIWNGFDAKASFIDIVFNANELGYIPELIIKDNGEGINLSNIDDTFGAFLDSQKKHTYQRSSNYHGKKGKGRFSFIKFGSTAIWMTKFQQENKILEYDITISKNSKNFYDLSTCKISKESSTGTELHIQNLEKSITADLFTSAHFRDYIAQQFGWFLYLNRDKNYQVAINGETIDYASIIGYDETSIIEIKDSIKTYVFNISYIRWKNRIGDKFYYYYLNSQKHELAKELTSFNNKANDFYHSVYVESTYFDNFIFEEKPSNRLDGIKNQSDYIYKKLVAELRKYLFSKEKLFIREKGANNLISKYEAHGIIPHFGNNKYDQERKKDLINVIKEIYCIQPKIFQGLRKEQEKTSIGFLNLLLDTDERENILSILNDIVNLSPEERKQLSETLKVTSFNRIMRTIKMIQSRYEVINLLRSLVYDLKMFTTERDHLQKAVEDNYWLFGEQFHLVSADVNFEKMLSKYLYFLDGEKQNTDLNSEERLRRPDIFMCRKRTIDDTYDHSSVLEENIIVELKRPTVPIGKEQFRQIEDYLDFISKQEQFNSQLRRWKFFVVSNKVDDFIKEQYESFKHFHKRFLVHTKGLFEIYAMTWDDIFKSFELKHQYILDKLELDTSKMHNKIEAKTASLNQNVSLTSITERLKAINTQNIN